MRYDIIILSYTTNEKQRAMTRRCIESIRAAENKIKFDILVIESFKEQNYAGATNLFYRNTRFNYNHSLNYGINRTKNPYILCCNNDLFFHKGFAEKLYNAFAMGYKSVSPYCSHSHRGRANQGDHLFIGCQTGVHIAGWCIGVERKMIRSIGGFNEAVEFWYSDNLYGEQLQVANIKHALVCNAIVDHLGYGSQTLYSLSVPERKRLTKGQKRKYLDAVEKLKRDAKEKKVIR